MRGKQLRLDKWLWHARFFKSRSLAARLCAGARVRINRAVVDKTHATVKPDRNQFDRDYFAPWLGALRNAMREHRISSATTPRGKRTRPAVGHIGSPRSLRRSPDA